jgi:hypothetical protein
MVGTKKCRFCTSSQYVLVDLDELGNNRITSRALSALSTQYHFHFRNSFVTVTAVSLLTSETATWVLDPKAVKNINIRWGF